MKLILSGVLAVTLVIAAMISTTPSFARSSDRFDTRTKITIRENGDVTKIDQRIRERVLNNGTFITDERSSIKQRIGGVRTVERFRLRERI